MCVPGIICVDIGGMKMLCLLCVIDKRKSVYMCSMCFQNVCVVT